MNARVTVCVGCGALNRQPHEEERFTFKTIHCETCKLTKGEEPIILDPATCQHEQFAAFVDTDRIVDQEGGSNELLGIYACIRIFCVECQTPFHFKGLEYGLTPDKPRCEVGGLEARMPIGPGLLPIESSGEAVYSTFKRRQ